MTQRRYILNYDKQRGLEHRVDTLEVKVG